jgi:hypothetical protein
MIGQIGVYLVHPTDSESLLQLWNQRVRRGGGDRKGDHDEKRGNYCAHGA